MTMGRKEKLKGARRMAEQEPGNGKAPEIIELTIRFHRLTGQIDVVGPIGDGILCYGMLKKAEHAIHEHQEMERLKASMTRPQIVGPEALRGLPPVGKV